MNYDFKPINKNYGSFNRCCNFCDFPRKSPCVYAPPKPINECCNRIRMEICLDNMSQNEKLIFLGLMIISSCRNNLN